MFLHKLRLIKYNAHNRRIFLFVRSIFGFYPKNIKLYDIALRHKSKSIDEHKNHKVTNERLEFLGDSVINLIIADYLFKRYPLKDEGFLTEMRSRLVCRNRLNELSDDLGITIAIDTVRPIPNNCSIKGNALEALIGAMYIDKGYNFTYNIVVKKIIPNYIDIEDVEQTDTNYKKQVINFAQKYNLDIDFVLCQTDASIGFEVDVVIDGNTVGHGRGSSIKLAEQDAAHNSIGYIEEKEQLYSCCEKS
ncbi:MAG: ribonuclease III domain-containing protein [Lentimicrobiaceae bacterium]|nr:ribonuclease III domain-containing protein [Lentimicrobiaceae bacterium]